MAARNARPFFDGDQPPSWSAATTGSCAAVSGLARAWRRRWWARLMPWARSAIGGFFTSAAVPRDSSAHALASVGVDAPFADSNAHGVLHRHEPAAFARGKRKAIGLSVIGRSRRDHHCTSSAVVRRRPVRRHLGRVSPKTPHQTHSAMGACVARSPRQIKSQTRPGNAGSARHHP